MLALVANYKQNRMRKPRNFPSQAAVIEGSHRSYAKLLPRRRPDARAIVLSPDTKKRAMKARFDTIWYCGTRVL
jgi:hypothetical protein